MQVGLLYFSSAFWGFYPVFEAIFTFPQERMMLEKERSSGMYRLSSFFMALTLGDLPMQLVLPTIYHTITYWMAGLKSTPESFLSGLFINLYGVLCSQGLGLAIGAVVMDQIGHCTCISRRFSFSTHKWIFCRECAHIHPMDLLDRSIRG